MFSMKPLGILVLIVIIGQLPLRAQFKSNINDTIVNAKMLSVSYSVQVPAADMADRFGVNNNIGGSFSFKIRNNFLIGVEANYLFGGNIREDTILNYLFTQSGNLIGVDGLFDAALLFERGFTLWGKFGKIFPAFNSNPNSGITAMIGAGFIQHKIKIDDVNNQLPYVSGDYAKGYDRLTNGLAISQYIGYTHLDKRKLLNFSIGLEAIEGFTQSRRDWNFDQMSADQSSRLDLLFGIKVAWILPFYGSNEERFYTY
jgi:hypothetical protein